MIFFIRQKAEPEKPYYTLEQATECIPVFVIQLHKQILYYAKRGEAYESV